LQEFSVGLRRYDGSINGSEKGGMAYKLLSRVLLALVALLSISANSAIVIRRGNCSCILDGRMYNTTNCL